MCRVVSARRLLAGREPPSIPSLRMNAAAATDDPHDLKRFLDAQRGVVEDALAELAAGRKRGHWMWFVFPQLRGLGHSGMAQRYGIASLAEAQAYAAHPVLGERLREATRRVLAAHRREGRGAEAMLGGIDAVKLRSSLTLFARACPGEPLFAQGLDALFEGVYDPLTLELGGVGD